MRIVIGLCVSLCASAAFAAATPEILPDGNYTMDCQVLQIKKLDPPAPGEKLPPVADAEGFVRYSYPLKGTETFATKGDTTTIKATYSYHFDSGTLNEVDDMTMTEKAIGGNQVDETATLSITGTTTWDNPAWGSPSPFSNSTSWESTRAVEGDFMIDLKVKNKSGIETPGHSESVTTKRADGAYTYITYLREGYHVDRTTSASGLVTRGHFVYQNQMSCTLTPVK